MNRQESINNYANFYESLFHQQFERRGQPFKITDLIYNKKTLENVLKLNLDFKDNIDILKKAVTATRSTTKCILK